MINQGQFLENIIIPALEHIGHDSRAARKLLLGTALVESQLTYIKQLNCGPALGFFQMEPVTHDDIWVSYLRYRTDLGLKLKAMVGGRPHEKRLMTNLEYAAAMCRVHYLRVSDPLPSVYDDAGMAHYWKDHYNTCHGKGTVDKYLEAWEKWGIDV